METFNEYTLKELLSHDYVPTESIRESVGVTYEWENFAKSDGFGGFFFLGVPQDFIVGENDSVTFVWQQADLSRNVRFTMLQANTSIDYVPLMERIAHPR